MEFLDDTCLHVMIVDVDQVLLFVKSLYSTFFVFQRLEVVLSHDEIHMDCLVLDELREHVKVFVVQLQASTICIDVLVEEV